MNLRETIFYRHNNMDLCWFASENGHNEIAELVKQEQGRRREANVLLRGKCGVAVEPKKENQNSSSTKTRHNSNI